MSSTIDSNIQHYVGVSLSRSRKLCCAINGVPEICIGLCMDTEEPNTRVSRSLCSSYDSEIQKCWQNIKSSNGIN